MCCPSCFTCTLLCFGSVPDAPKAVGRLSLYTSDHNVMPLSHWKKRNTQTIDVSGKGYNQHLFPNDSVVGNN